MYTVAALLAFHVTLCKCPALHVSKALVSRRVVEHIYLVTDTVAFFTCENMIKDYGHCTHVCVANQDGACCFYSIINGNGLHNVCSIIKVLKYI